ncbi:MAG: LysR family transcriptional regulator [Gammaproteobacteria bacterium]|nr:LysR family transcriptional regulator [Gammaproteobacteria bacterium]
MILRFNGASIRQLKVFKSVVEHSGFSAAQVGLNTSAASISIQMKELEERLGMTLCERGRTGFKLTERGRAVYEAAKSLFASFDNFNLEVANIREELIGEIYMGIQDNVSSNPSFKMPQTFAQFNQRKNNVQFRIEEAASSDQEARTLEGRYHLAIGIFHHRLPGLTYQKLFDEGVSLFCAKGHPLFDIPDDKISLKDIQQARFASTGLIQNALSTSKYFTKKPDAIAESMDAISLLLLSGQYVGFFPNHLANTWIERGQMKSLLPEKTAGKVEFHMITKRANRHPYAVETFIQDLLACHNIENK